MKTRALRTYKILAVAITATAGCGPNPGVASAPTPSDTGATVATPADPPANTDPAAKQDVPAAPTQATGPAVAAPTASPDPAAAAAAAHPLPDKEDPKLVALGENLASTPRAKIAGMAARFRPLCDKDGYPLVGNVARKGQAGYEPSTFCEMVRNHTLK